MAASDAIYTSGVLLSTNLYVFGVLATTPEEGRIRRTEPPRPLRSSSRSWACPSTTPCTRSPPRSAHVKGPHGQWDPRGASKPQSYSGPAGENPPSARCHRKPAMGAWSFGQILRHQPGKMPQTPMAVRADLRSQESSPPANWWILSTEIGQ